jgi:hypothetical protein
VTRFFSCSSHRRDQLTHEPQAPLHHSFGAREATIFSKHGSPGAGPLSCSVANCRRAELLICFTISKVFRQSLPTRGGGEKKLKKVLAYVRW